VTSFCWSLTFQFIQCFLPFLENPGLLNLLSLLRSFNTLKVCHHSSRLVHHDALQTDRHPPGSVCSGSDASCRAGFAIRC
jgi:hypothetical protein